MSPDEIRDVFEKGLDRKEEIEWAVTMALLELRRLPDAEARAVSPYSLLRLTSGLPHAEAIIAVALRIKPTLAQATSADMISTSIHAKSVTLGEITVSDIPPGPKKIRIEEGWEQMLGDGSTRHCREDF